ncbi:MAG: hypothetical protein DYG83_12035 [Candidatus Brocadia sp. AMX2]|uniref:Transporter n=1 Tax=Candidatus Brocadia sinica JPN1 TaxID=1197129 RepID=A0ABQ0JU78_9BACT|nr:MULTISPECIES: hypothetical protein [Brocadia]KXK31384.1 MAG: hypothetical protein UZ01_00908 [Candidatus Brocadia sinica]MBC6933263.1 hypothetical protein [Candidatus Brocadia sp.]MBL1168902.1 hypothetical protein [Candidatus Brocadia sp. AMX1]NOG41854.1 hypothetical protein [Planctomycetota bacterium]KAA0241798.1 MAG: hypothetical protein EDM70_16930 [Candidatus Brocadia sp. AMX2]
MDKLNKKILWLIILLCALGGLVAPKNVLALRPFVTTDADVVEPNIAEIELGIFGLHEQKHPGPDEFVLDVSSIRFNYGLPWDSEIVLETVGELIDSEYVGTLGVKEKQFADTAAFYKKVWWRSGENGGWTPNFATETGFVFPTEKGTSGLDFEGAGIFSWYLEKLTCHLTLGGGTKKEAFEHNTRGLYIYGIIVDIPLPQCKKLHLVSEYSGEKVENAILDHQLLGGVVWEGPLNIDYDIAGFAGLNSESVDWGITMGITFFIGKKSGGGKT